MIHRPWLSAYPEGVPADIDPETYPSVNALLERSFASYAESTAFSNLGVTLSFRAADTLSRDFAAYLQNEAGLNPGDRVAVMMPNLLQYPVVVFGILRAGMVVVNVNPMYTPRELEHQLTDSGARAIIVLENFAHTVAAVADRTGLEVAVVTRVGDHFPPLKAMLTNLVVKHLKRMVPAWKLPRAVAYKTALRRGRATGLQPGPVGPQDIAFLQYTGGTTGVAKGAMLTHRNIVSNVLQAVAWARPFLSGPGDLVVTPLPLYHVFSLTANLFSFMELGGHNLLITNPRDLPGFVKELKRAPFTYITGVNTLFVALLHSPGFATVDFRRLKASMAGGMAAQRSVAEEWQRVTGCPLAQGYGLTETSPIVSANPLDGRAFNGSVGVPLPSTEVDIRDDEGQRLGTNDAGEIFVRGPQVMKGYWNRPEATAEVMCEGGWLRTGDIGRIDEAGLLFIEDRKKDLIIVSGFNVYPNEIEDVVAGHPGVLEVAAVGIPDEESGEAVRVFVVKKDPALSETELIAYCRERLTGYKIPKRIEFRDELPKTSVGKVLRRALREQTQ
jgi:long-chain acyl-CoA synthetase